MNGKRIVIKIGGSTLGQPDTTLEDVVWLQHNGYEPVVVHGGGNAITDWLDRLGLESRFVDGLRVTDEASIDVVVSVLAGLVNKRLVAELNSLGGHAAGISGADGATVRATLKDPTLGLVGEPQAVDPTLIEALISTGYIPVVAPVCSLVRGTTITPELLNVNADTAAADIGGGIKADQFIFLTDVPGVSDRDGRVFSSLSEARAKQLVEDGTISGGMIPKVEACLRALHAVPSSCILDARIPHALRAMVGREKGSGSYETSVGTRIG